MLLMGTSAPHFLLDVLLEQQGRWDKSLQSEELLCFHSMIKPKNFYLHQRMQKGCVSKILQNKTYDDLH